MLHASLTPFDRDILNIEVDRETAGQLHAQLVRAPDVGIVGDRFLSILERFLAHGPLDEYARPLVGLQAPDGEQPIEDFGPYHPCGDGYAPGDLKALPGNAGRW